MHHAHRNTHVACSVCLREPASSGNRSQLFQGACAWIIFSQNGVPISASAWSCTSPPLQVVKKKKRSKYQTEKSENPCCAWQSSSWLTQKVCSFRILPNLLAPGTKTWHCAHSTEGLIRRERSSEGGEPSEKTPLVHQHYKPKVT